MMNQQFCATFLVALILSLNTQPLHAQQAMVCEENAPYWEQWQENATFRAYMTGSVWNVTSFDISPDGKTLAVANGNSLILYDPQTLTPILQLKSPDIIETARYQGYRGVHWSPNGTQLAAIYSVSDSFDHPNPLNGIQIWDIQTRQQTHLLSGHAQVMDWSPDGLTIAEVANQGDVSLWDVKGGTVSLLEKHTSRIGRSIMHTLIWSPDGQTLVGSSDAGGVLSVYTPGEGNSQFLETPEKEVGYIVWVPAGNELVIGNDLSANLFFLDVSTWDITRTLSGGKGNLLDLQWSPDGRWLARGTWHGLYVWDMTTDNTAPIYAFEDHMPPFVRMAWMPDSRSLISVDFEGSLYRWNRDTGCIEAALLKEWTPR